MKIIYPKADMVIGVSKKLSRDLHFLSKLMLKLSIALLLMLT